MNPISNNQMFSDDFQRFVLQNPNVQFVNRPLVPPPPFRINKSEKTEKSKKDIGKQKENEKKEKEKPL